MKVLIQTAVKQSVSQVFAGFNANLFTSLAPPFPPVKLLRYDGEKAGDIVRIELNFVFFKQIWQSNITANEVGETSSFFIDEGTELPFFLSYWQHKHLIENRKGITYIVDDITFKTPYLITDFLIYPLLYLQFLYRKPIYRKIFSGN